MIAGPRHPTSPPRGRISSDRSCHNILYTPTIPSSWSHRTSFLVPGSWSTEFVHPVLPRKRCAQAVLRDGGNTGVGLGLAIATHSHSRFTMLDRYICGGVCVRVCPPPTARGGPPSRRGPAPGPLLELGRRGRNAKRILVCTIRYAAVQRIESSRGAECYYCPSLGYARCRWSSKSVYP